MTRRIVTLIFILLPSALFAAAPSPSPLPSQQGSISPSPVPDSSSMNAHVGCMVDFNGDGHIDTIQLDAKTCQKIHGAVISMSAASGSFSTFNPPRTTHSSQGMKDTSRPSQTPSPSGTPLVKPATHQALPVGEIRFPIKIRPGKFTEEDFDNLKGLLDNEPKLKDEWGPGNVCWNFADIAERQNPQLMTYTLMLCCEETWEAPRVFMSYGSQVIVESEREKGFWRITKLFHHAINDYHYDDGTLKFYEPQFIKTLDSEKYPEQSHYRKYIEVDLDLNKNGQVDSIEASQGNNKRKLCVVASYENIEAAKYFFDSAYGPGSADKVFVHTPQSPRLPQSGTSCQELFSGVDSEGWTFGGISRQSLDAIRKGELAKVF